MVSFFFICQHNVEDVSVPHEDVAGLVCDWLRGQALPLEPEDGAGHHQAVAGLEADLHLGDLVRASGPQQRETLCPGLPGLRLPGLATNTKENAAHSLKIATKLGNGSN